MATTMPTVRHIARAGVSIVLTAGLLISSTVAVADPVNPSQQSIDTANSAVDEASQDLARLAADLVKANADADAMRQQLGLLKQQVNKALVDYSEAQRRADEAAHEAEQAQRRLDATNKDLQRQQQELAVISRAAYRRGASTALPRLAGRNKLDDFLDGSAMLSAQASKQRAVVDGLAATRLAQANETSQLKKARHDAQAAADAAHRAADTAQSSIDEIGAKIATRQAEAAQLEADRTAAQVRLDAAKVNQHALRDQAAEYRAFVTARAEQKARRAQVEAIEIAHAQAADELEVARAQQQQAQQAAAAGAPDAPDTQRQVAAAVQAVQVAESRADSFAEKAEQARGVLRQANEALNAAAEAVDFIKSFTGGATGSADAKVGSSDEPAGAVERADSIVSGVAEKAGAAGQLVDIVGGAVDEPPAPEGTQAAKIQHSHRANPGQSYSLLQLYKGFDTVTPADLGLVTKDSITAFNGTHSEKVEAVIARAKSMLGTPYAWGGGNAAGPTRGIRDGGVADSYGDYNKIGFDCSGLVLYAFAGVGVALPHYTGYQYQKGTKIPISNIQRGDLLFWGPNAEYHVAIYLGNGQMIEAPESGSTVKISPVRYSGMSPYAVRLV